MANAFKWSIVKNGNAGEGAGFCVMPSFTTVEIAGKNYMIMLNACTPLSIGVTIVIRQRHC